MQHAFNPRTCRLVKVPVRTNEDVYCPECGEQLVASPGEPLVLLHRSNRAGTPCRLRRAEGEANPAPLLYSRIGDGARQLVISLTADQLNQMITDLGMCGVSRETYGLVGERRLFLRLCEPKVWGDALRDVQLRMRPSEPLSCAGMLVDHVTASARNTTPSTDMLECLLTWAWASVLETLLAMPLAERAPIAPLILRLLQAMADGHFDGEVAVTGHVRDYLQAKLPIDVLPKACRSFQVPELVRVLVATRAMSILQRLDLDRHLDLRTPLAISQHLGWVFLLQAPAYSIPDGIGKDVVMLGRMDARQTDGARTPFDEAQRLSVGLIGEGYKPLIWRLVRRPHQFSALLVGNLDDFAMMRTRADQPRFYAVDAAKATDIFLTVVRG